MAYTEKRTCKRCGFTAPVEWFTKTSYRSSGFVSKTRKPVCPMCLQEERDKRKWQNRAIVKARWMLYSHAKKYGMKPAQFAKKFGWSIIQMAHDINHNLENWCPYCTRAYKDMGHGLRDLTLDIINPEEPPYYTNVRYCCATCNTMKGHRGAADYGFHLAMIKARQEFLNSRASAQPGTLLNPQHRMGLKLGLGPE